MSRSPTGPIQITPPCNVDGEPVIEARITLSEETWRALLADQTVGMFEADTLANRIRNFLFWAVIASACEAADADEIAASIAQAEADYALDQRRQATTRAAGDGDDDIPF